MTPPAVNPVAPAAANGAAWAAFVAAGIGCTAFGLFTDLSEVSARFSAMLNWYNPSGSLSGVAGCAIILWLVSWLVLDIRWKNRHLAGQGRLMWLTVLLVLLGLLTTFPPFYSLFVHD